MIKRLIGMLMAFAIAFCNLSLLSVNAEDEYQVSAANRYTHYEAEISALKAENEKLKAQNATYLAQIMAYEDEIEMYEILIMDISLERGDVNNDGFINAVDASQILAYYAYTSTGGHLDFMDFLEGKVDKEES